MSTNECSFNPDEMAPLLLQDWLPKWIKSQEIVAKDPILKNDVADYGQSRQKLYELYSKKAYRIHKLLNYSDGHMPSILNGQFPETVVTVLHQEMFIPTIRNLATDKQCDKWLPLAIGYQIIGCYAQTELGHGSDVQNLETTATYDLKTEEFIINSPTVTATKWWIGDLGFTANHVVTHAQLFINGRHYGVQTFLVQIRDLETHHPMQGIQVGDVGAKYGYNTKDNGFLRFNNVRIPRDNMLMRYSKVNKQGEFIHSQNEKIGYATMMQVRQAIIANSGISLAQGLAIAIPYSHYRKQFKDYNNIEQPIIEYQTQQDKLTPLLADAYAQMFGCNRIKVLLQENIKRITDKMDFSLMGDLHALLCCCKAVYTWNSHFGLDRIRQSCGGHGFLKSSGIVTIQTEFAPTCTYEGENTVLLLQTGRYLLKALNKAVKQQHINENVEYLNNIGTAQASKATFNRIEQLFCPETVRKLLRFNAAFKVFKAAQQYQEKTAQFGQRDAWNKHAGIVLTEASAAHTHYWTTKNFLDTLMKVNDENIKSVLSKLCCLYGLQRIIENPLGYFEGEHMNGEQFELILAAKEELLKQLKPDLQGLVDSFKFHPNSLRSDLITKNPYASLLESAQKSSVNSAEFQERLHAKLSKLIPRL